MNAFMQHTRKYGDEEKWWCGVVWYDKVCNNDGVICVGMSKVR